MRTSSTNVKLFAILAFTGAIFAFVMLWSFHVQNQMLERNLAQERRASAAIVNRVIDGSSAALLSFARDYSRWDDMVQFVSTRDQKWSKVNIEPELGLSDVDVIWICDTTASPIYGVDISGDSLASAYPLSAEDRDSIVGNNRFHHFFVRSQWGLVEIQQAPIQPTADTLRQSPVRGYFIVGRVWSSAHLERFFQLAGSQLSIEYSDERMDSLATQGIHDATVNTSNPLKDLRGRTTAYLIAKKDLTDWQNFRHLLLTQMDLMLGLLAIVLILLVLSLYFWVSRPLTAVSRGLEQENPESLGSLLRQNSEFGRLARLVSESIAQRRSFVEEIIERQKAQAALRGSEERLSAITGSAKDGIIMLDADGNVCFWNPAAEQLTGYSADEIMGRPFHNVVVPTRYPADSHATFPDKRKTYLDDSLGSTLELKAVRKDGVEVPIEISMSSSILSNRQYAIVIIRDITERKWVEDSLRRSEMKFRTLYDSTSDAVMLADESGFLDCNKAALAIFSCATREEFCAKHPSDVSPPKQPDGTDSLTLANQHIATAMEKGSNHFEWIHKRVDTGKTFYADVLLNAMELDGKQVVQAVVRDITERKRTEKAMRESESLYRGLIETTGTGYVIVDYKGMVVDANPEYVRLTGRLKLDEIRGKSVVDWTADYDEEKNAKAVEKCIKTGRIKNLEIDYVDPNGKITPVEVNATVIETSGTPIILSMCRDITTRKQAAGALRESESRLQAIFNKVATGIFIIDCDTQVILDANQTAMEMAGLPREMVIGQICHSLVCPALAGKCPVKDLGQKIDHSERKLLHADGHQIDILKTVHPISIGGRDCYLESFIDITERKQAEVELRESEERFRTLVKNQGEGISIVDVDEIITFVNPAAERIFDVEPGTLIGKSLFDFVDDDGLAIIRAQTEERSRGSNGSYELEIIRPSGERRSLLVTVTAQHDDQGQYLGSFGVFRDITERKRADEERSKFMSVIDSAPEAIAVLNADGTILYVNHAFETISGMESNQAIDRHYEALAQKLYANIDYVIPWERVQAGESWTETIAYQGNDGGFHLIDQSISAIRSQLGEIINYVVFSRDVTEERELEIRARWADERLRLSIDGMVDGLTLWDVHMGPDGSIQEFVCSEANPAALRMLGKERQVMLGRSVQELMTGQKDYDLHDLFKRVLDKGQPAIIEHVHILRNEDRVVLTINVWAVGTGVACLMHDVTQRLDLETQLRQAQKLEAVGSLAAGIAHEINTPIQFVGDNIRFLADSFSGLMNVLEHHRACREKMASLLGEREELQQLRDLDRQVDVDYLKTEIPLAVEQSLEGVSRVSTIVRAMKDFSHVDEREMVMADINQMLDTTLTVARNELKYVADVAKDFAPDLPTVECFRNDLNQVFLNLFINAAHAIGDVVSAEGQGRGTITVATRRDGDEIVISISDTGAGIPESIRDRIFDHFFTTKEVGKGTGQGLSIARSIVVEKHKGTIAFDSEIGKGTTFYIRLPIIRKEVEHAESQHPVRG